jgi:hypothetical protein
MPEIARWSVRDHSRPTGSDKSRQLTEEFGRGEKSPIENSIDRRLSAPSLVTTILCKQDRKPM